MSKRIRKTTPRKWTIADFDGAMNAIAPTALAQDWDNVGLLIGDPAAPLRSVLLCIDLTPPVVEEALVGKIDLVMAYHPPIFKPVARLRADSPATDAAVFRCVRGGVSIYSTHTALDAADGGTNDTLAAFCGVAQAEPLEYVSAPGQREFKLVVFVPEKEVERVGEAIFAAGGGHIGEYSHCAYRLRGMGSFLGGESTNPTIGRRGKLEFVDEVRLETVVPQAVLPQVIRALMAAHSYEEPAFDIYPLEPRPVRGIGRTGLLPRPVTLGTLARNLKKATKAETVQIVGSPQRKIRRVIIVVGAAGALPFRAAPGWEDAVITGEIRHHDALRLLRLESNAIALNHWSSERPTLAKLADRLREALSGVKIIISKADCEPFRPV